MSRYFYAGAPFRPGTSLPDNVSGNCEHRHRTPEAAAQCIDRHAEAMAKIGGTADRQIMVYDEGDREPYLEIDGTVEGDVEESLLHALIMRLTHIQVTMSGDPEIAHQAADGALLDYIDDDRVRAAYQAIPGWYA